MTTQLSSTIRRIRWTVALLLILSGATLSADRIRMRTGKVIDGMFIGADSKSVRILHDDGRVTEVKLEDALAVEFSARKPATPPPAAAPAKAAPAAAAPSALVVLIISYRCEYMGLLARDAAAIY